MPNEEYHEFTWTNAHLSIRVGIDYWANWSIVDYLGVTSIEPARSPLPISKTGYRSNCFAAGTVAQNGGPIEVVRMILDEAAASPEWQEYLSSTRQGSLF